MLSGCFGFVPLVCRCSTLAPCFQRERCLSLLNAFANGSTPSWAYRGYNLSAGDNEHASQCTRLVLSWVGFLWCVLFLVIEAYWYACLCLPARSQDDGNDNSGSCVLGGYEDARVDLRFVKYGIYTTYYWMAWNWSPKTDGDGRKHKYMGDTLCWCCFSRLQATVLETVFFAMALFVSFVLNVFEVVVSDSAARIKTQFALVVLESVMVGVCFVVQVGFTRHLDAFSVACFCCVVQKNHDGTLSDDDDEVGSWWCGQKCWRCSSLLSPYASDEVFQHGTAEFCCLRFETKDAAHQRRGAQGGSCWRSLCNALCACECGLADRSAAHLPAAQQGVDDNERPSAQHMVLPGTSSRDADASAEQDVARPPDVGQDRRSHHRHTHRHRASRRKKGRRNREPLSSS